MSFKLLLIGPPHEIAIHYFLIIQSKDIAYFLSISTVTEVDTNRIEVRFLILYSDTH